ncbi:NTP transferase domain-containing protein, partial [bacterium]|nr:NTP transferase domain-containing protein [bacterium]
MKVLILAAGEGLRLRPLTENKPKALVEVGGVKLVDHVFRFLKSANFDTSTDVEVSTLSVPRPSGREVERVDQIACVVGYRSDEMRAHLKKYPEVQIYQNDEYKKGNIFTLTAAKDFLDDTFLIMNVDHIYPSKMLQHIVGN